MGEPGEASAGGAVGGGDPRLESIDPELVARMTEDEIKKFIDTGRTGRRNALPDVNQPDNVTTSTAGMAEALESLSVGKYLHGLDSLDLILSISKCIVLSLSILRLTSVVTEDEWAVVMNCYN